MEYIIAIAKEVMCSAMSVCVLVGWFVSRITQNLLHRPWVKVTSSFEQGLRTEPKNLTAMLHHCVATLAQHGFFLR